MADSPPKAEGLADYAKRLMSSDEGAMAESPQILEDPAFQARRQMLEIITSKKMSAEQKAKESLKLIPWYRQKQKPLPPYGETEDILHTPEVDEEVERVRDPFAYSLKNLSPEEREKALKERENSFEHQIEERYWQLRWREYHEEQAKNSKQHIKENESYIKKFLPPIPNLSHPRAPPFVKKAFTRKEAQDKFLDHMKQRLFSIWGYRKRPYPEERPIDFEQAYGYDRLDEYWYKVNMTHSGGWWYKDRLGRSRGPADVVHLRSAWMAGIIDRYTFIYGLDMTEWQPIGQVYGMEKCINTIPVKLATSLFHLSYNISAGLPWNTPKKRHEPKTVEQRQKEAIENHERLNAVYRLNKGAWPGNRPYWMAYPWASGNELSTRMKLSETIFIDKAIKTEERKALLRRFPGLRPKDFRNLEMVYDALVYHGPWYREDLGMGKIGPPYESSEILRRKQEYEARAAKIERIFDCIDKGPKVRFPRKPGEKFIVEWPEGTKEREGQKRITALQNKIEEDQEAGLKPELEGLDIEDDEEY